MNDTTVTFRTEKKLKEQASDLFNSMGMNLSTALNLFMRQAVMQRRFPCSLEVDYVMNMKSTYPAGFFELFGTGAELGLDKEPTDLPLEPEDLRL